VTLRGLGLAGLAVLGVSLGAPAVAPARPAEAARAGGAPSPAATQARQLASLDIGIADQKTTMFYDPRFAALHVRHARLVIPWDVLSVGWQRQLLDNWVKSAALAHVSPLLTFGHSRRPGRRRQLPSPKRLRTEFLRLRKRYPAVREWATWNEPNHCGEPLCHKPELAARYYDALRRACPRCTILAAEVLDMPNMARWVKAFRRAARVEPRYWGLHNYIDANRFRTSGTRRLLAATRGQIWFTETGGVVFRRTTGKVRFHESPTHAAHAVSWVFRRLVPLSPRVTRVYLYHWDRTDTADNWDSALLTPAGRPRPAFAVLEREVRQVTAARECAAALAATRR
jgi:hypothetical protein